MYKSKQKISFEANLPLGADVVAITKALETLAIELSAKELTAIANVVKNDPIKLSLAKGFLGLK